MKFLLIEDDPEVSAFVAKGLGEQGHIVDTTANGQQGLFLCLNENYDLVIADRRLPGLDGLSIVKAARASGVKTPILFLTTVSGLEDRVEGLDAGADDYLVKPFAFSELLARVNALLRRPPISDSQPFLRIGDLEIDLMKRLVTRAGQVIELLPREYELLLYLARHADKIVTRTMLLEHVWDFHFDPRTSVVETHISRLRAKIDKPFDQPLIHTVPRAGYSLHA